MTSSKITTKKINYCSNCGKYGHSSKKCTDPITSLGIINIMIDGLKINKDAFLKFLDEKYIDIDDYNFSRIDNIQKLDQYKKNIKFLLIQRKHSLAYIEFIRGKYDINNLNLKTNENNIQKKKNSNYIIKNDLYRLFQNMCPKELDEISKLDFDYLWNNLWKKTSKKKIFQKEYENSKENFNFLIENKYIFELLKVKPLYETPEWGFPKGRRNLYEKNLECALREFEEETCIPVEKISLLKKIECIVEEYTASNNFNYRHIYYLSVDKSDKYNSIQNNSFESNYEVGESGWYSWDEAVEMIRGHYTEKIKIINQIYFLFLNLLIDYESIRNLTRLNKVDSFDSIESENSIESKYQYIKPNNKPHKILPDKSNPNNAILVNNI